MKILIIAIAAAIAIVFSLAVTPYVAPTAPYTATATRILSERFGSTVSIGKMRIHLLPHPYFTIDDLVIASPETSFSHTPIIRAKSVRGSLSLWGALSKHAVTSVAIEGFEATFIKNASGLTNIDRLLALHARRANEQSQDGWKLTLEHIVAEHGRIVINDLAERVTREVGIERYSAADIAAAKNISAIMRLKAAVFGGNESDVELACKVTYEGETGSIHARGCTARMLGMDATLDATVGLKTQPLSFELHAISPDATHEPLSRLFPTIKGPWPAGISWRGPATLDLYLKGTKARTTIRFQGEFSRSTVTVGDYLAKPPGRPLKIGFAGINSTEQLVIEALNVRLGESLIQIHGSLLHGANHRAQLTLKSTAFNLAELQPSIPLLSLFESAERPSLTMSVRGPLDASSQRVVQGQFSANAARIMDIDVNNLTFDIHQHDQRIELPHIAALAYGGKLSANGTVTAGKPQRYAISAVIDGCNLASIKALGGAITGTGSLVMELTSAGSDATSMAATLEASGTLVAEKASIPSLIVGKNLLGLSTWRLVEANVENTSLSGDAIIALESTDASAQNLRASFTMKPTGIHVTDLRYLNPRYTLWLLGSITPQGMVDASGSIWLNKAETAKVLPTASVRKTITNSGGDLQIPFTLKGTGSGFVTRVAADGFKDVLEGNASPTPKVASATPEQLPAAKTDEQKTSEKKQSPAVKKTKTKKTKATKRTRRTKRRRTKSSTRIPASQSDDVLKVLIR